MTVTWLLAWHESAGNEEQTAHLQTVLLHQHKLGADPDTEARDSNCACAQLDGTKKPSSATAPLGKAPLRCRGTHRIRCHKGLVGLVLPPV